MSAETIRSTKAQRVPFCRACKDFGFTTGIWPVCECGWESARGFVSDSRFGAGQVIQRTNRDVTRKWRAGEFSRKEGVQEHQSKTDSQSAPN